MNQRRIVSTGTVPEWFRDCFEPEFPFSSVSDSSLQELLDELDGEVFAIVARGSTFIGAEVMDRAPTLRVIARTGVGYDTVDVDEASRRGIAVVYTPGAMSRAVAEHAVGLILSCAKQYRRWHSALQEGEWDARYREFSLDLEGSTVGIIGYGRIGRQVRLLLRPFDVRILAVDPYIDHASLESDDVEFVTLEEMLPLADATTLHVPLTQETLGMVNRSNVHLFKTGAILVNTSRGLVVNDLDMLADCLDAGQLRAIALDVFPEEPPDYRHRLFGHPRFFCTGHVAARTPAAQKRILETVMREVTAFAQGREPNLENLVNPELFGGEPLRERR